MYPVGVASLGPVIGASLGPVLMLAAGPESRGSEKVTVRKPDLADVLTAASANIYSASFHDHVALRLQ